MKKLILRQLQLDDQDEFLSAMKRSQSLHSPWMTAPLTSDEFINFYKRFDQINQICFLLVDDANQIVGIFNLNEIVRGIFQNAYLGYSAIADFAGQGYMSQGLKLLLEKTFTELGLHRLEANIQPDNIQSINLVKHNGFRKEGLSKRYLKINGIWKDFERWAITYEDWIELSEKMKVGNNTL